MCGRYTSKKNPVEIAEQFNAADHVTDKSVQPDYNVAPTKTVPVVRAQKPTAPESGPGASAAGVPAGRELVVMKWGLIPSWANGAKIGSRMFNARAESVKTTAAFRSAYKRRRCIVPADGWYEWKSKEDGTGKQPFYMTPGDGRSLSMAGLWEIWGDGHEWLTTFTILTTPAQGQLTQIHDRMPFLLAEGDWTRWLDINDAEVDEILAHPDLSLADELELRPVGSEVGKVANNSASLIERQEPEVVRLF